MADKVRVLHYTTHDEECGIAKYQAQFIEGMKSVPEIENVVFKYSPNQTKVMPKEQFGKVIEELTEQLASFDILHIQHEHSFYKHSELVEVVRVARGLDKKVMFTIHTAPDALYQQPRLQGFGPRSLLHYLRAKKSAQYFLQNHLEPIKQADELIVHNQVTKDSLISHGVDQAKIRVIRHPVPHISFTKKSEEIKTNLHVQADDVIFCTVGFLSRSKGILHAVKALSFLPENYKLAIIGGMHPDSSDTSFYDEVTDAIKDSGLLERAYITGYIEDDDRLNALIRECNICVYPYDAQYYSYVSSGSLNTAIANHKAVIAYPTKSFLETNTEIDVITFCKSGNYYELARNIRDIDTAKAEKLSKEYAGMFSWDKEAVKFAQFYKELVSA